MQKDQEQKNVNQNAQTNSQVGELTSLDIGALKTLRVVSGMGAAALLYGLVAPATPAIVIGACVLTITSPLQMISEVKSIKARMKR